jgi:FlaA1/EpsC-like NDP-sugar epimerase
MLMKLKVGQPLPAKLVVLIGDILITLVSLFAAHLLKVPGLERYSSLRTAMVSDVLSYAFSANGSPISVFSATAFTLLLIAIFYIFDLYNLQIFGETTTLLSRLLSAGCLVLAVAFVLSLIASGMWGQVSLLQSVATAVAVAFAWRRFFSANSSVLLKQDSTAVIGSGPRAECIRSLMSRPESRYRFTGFVHAGEGAASGAGVLGSIADLNELVERHGVRQVIMATDSVPHSAQQTISYLKFQGVSFHRACRSNCSQTPGCRLPKSPT